MFNLIVTALRSMESDKPCEDLKKSLGEFSENIAQSPILVAQQAKGLIPNSSRVGTLSYSKAVRKSLEYSADKIKSLIISESQPGGEGVRLANDLAQTIKGVILIPDMLWARYIQNCDIIIIGADSITEDGVINKTGSLLLALLAREFEIPLLIAGSRLKLIPHSIILKTSPKNLPNDKLDFHISKNVEIHYPIFEIVPFNLITYIVTEKGKVVPEEMSERVHNLKKTYNMLNMI